MNRNKPEYLKNLTKINRLLKPFKIFFTRTWRIIKKITRRDYLNLLVSRLTFYVINVILVGLFFYFLSEKSATNLLISGLSLLGIIGLLAGIAYSGSNAQKDEGLAVNFRVAGDRFFHSLLAAIIAMLLNGAVKYINQNGFLVIQSEITKNISLLILGSIAIVYTIKSGRSFTIGFQMIIDFLNFKYPLRDERLFDDVKKDEEKTKEYLTQFNQED